MIKHLKKIIFILVMIVICVFISIYFLKTYIYPRTYFDIIKEEAIKNNIDPYLVLAIIKTESSFDKNATSLKEARGLMQIMDSTASELSSKENINTDDTINLYNETINIPLGCKYFSNLITRYEGNYYLAICAYNAGMGNVDKWIEQGIVSKDLSEYKNINLPFKETNKYLYKVVYSYKMYRLLYE